MDLSNHIEFVASEGELFAAGAERGQFDVEVATCPGWDVRELVRHLGLIHLWAAGHVSFPQSEEGDVEDLADLADYWPDLAGSWPDDAELITWYRATNANLVEVLKAAPIDVDCFTFLPAPSPLAMWARRQASEIAIHRFDVEDARGIASNFNPQFAADMLDELLCGFAPRPRELAMTNEQVVHVHAEDVGEHWYLTLGPEGIATSRQGDSDDLKLTATAAELYLLLWNRTPDSSVTMTGKTGLMELWHGNCRVRWS